ncbi:MAG: aspartate aminotransferase family protein [Alphaproteobacteria bacterium]|nr:aspartate aminotransferase family protein [Alphaproteobacteria bacterium]
MTDSTQNIINETKNLLIETYAPQPVVLTHGEGAYVWDTDGKKYLDFAIGIAVASLGHAPQAVLKTINDQAAKMMICQASYATEPKLCAAKLLTENSCFDRVYFCNSGTESVEAALKCARKWAYDAKGEHCNEIIAFRNSFHGRTYGAASVTEKRMSQPYFGPYIPGVHFATFNDLDSVKALVSENTAAIIVEPIQGEGGLTPATQDFMKGLRALCDAHKIVFILDEVQAGSGRIGTLFAYPQFGIEPDIACVAKGLGAGFPVGAMLAKEEVGRAIVPGTHGTTFGGNPLACAVAATVLTEMLKKGFMENVQKVSAYFVEGLKKIQRDSNKITDIRGMGLMIGVDTTIEIKQFMRALQKNGLLTTQAGSKTLRLTPPLVITPAHAQEALDILEKTLREES